MSLATRLMSDDHNLWCHNIYVAKNWTTSPATDTLILLTTVINGLVNIHLQTRQTTFTRNTLYAEQKKEHLIINTPLPLSMTFSFSSRLLHFASSSFHMPASTAGETWHSPTPTQQSGPHSDVTFNQSYSPL